MSNVLGSVVDVKKICKIARNKQIVTLIDGSQSIVHMPINVSELCCDFFVLRVINYTVPLHPVQYTSIKIDLTKWNLF